MKKLEQTISDIYAEQLETVYGFFYYKTFDRQLTEDLTSSTFVVFVEKMRANPDINKPVGFLYGVMKKVWLRHLQKKYRQVEQYFEDMDDFMSYVADEVETERSVDDIARVQAFINKLPQAQRTILHMRLIEQRPLKEICEVTGKDMNYVKTTQRRGLKRLRELVASSHMDTEGALS